MFNNYFVGNLVENLTVKEVKVGHHLMNL